MTEAQATMTGRSWRHFSVFWPFMLAGLIGRREPVQATSSTIDGIPVAPTGRAARAPASSGSATSDDSSDDGSDQASASSRASVPDSASEFDDGWRSVPGDDLAVAEEQGGGLPSAHLASSSAYKEHFDDMPVHDAYLQLSCQAARLGGMLFGDNVADSSVLTEATVNDMDEAAKVLGVDYIQTLYGHVNTSKLHRLVQHLSDELRNRGNLWEGETSVNEKLHGSCKRMFKRSNKRGPGVALQMMRCEEAQSAVIQELCDADEDAAASVPRGRSTTRRNDEDGSTVVAHASAGGSSGAAAARDGALDDHSGGSGAASASGNDSMQTPPIQTSQLTVSGRAQRVAVGDFHRIPALASLGAVLGVADDGCVTQHCTVRMMTQFEWGAPLALQHLRATDKFLGDSWYSFIHYGGNGDSLCRGRLRLVLRLINGQPRSCVVVQRMHRAVNHPGCVLSRYGCVCLAWDVESAEDTHPALEVADADRILRAEDVQVDWYALGDRLGLGATPTNKTNSTAERRVSRYFTNAFHP